MLLHAPFVIAALSLTAAADLVPVVRRHGSVPVPGALERSLDSDFSFDSSDSLSERAPHVDLIDRALEDAGFTVEKILERGLTPEEVIHAARDVEIDLTHTPHQLGKRATLAKVLGANGCSTGKKFALTFDDGVYDTSVELANLIKKNGGVGTWFINGYNWRCTYDLGEALQTIHKAGHMLGNHGWSHMDSAKLNYKQMHLQLKLVEDTFVNILGFKPLFFRPPYGSYNDLTLQVLAERGYKGAVMWDFDSGDTAYPKLASSKIISSYKSKINAFPKSVLSLNHDVQAQTTGDVMPAVVPLIKSKGYKMVSVGECLGLGQDSTKWYTQVTTGKLGTRNAKWTCANKPLPGAA